MNSYHCCRKSNPTDWIVNLGVTRRTSSPLFVRQRRVAKLIKHHGFQMSIDYYYSDDIALVLLEEKVEFDEFLRPVCLPANSTVQLEPGIFPYLIMNFDFHGFFIFSYFYLID